MGRKDTTQSRGSSTAAPTVSSSFTRLISKPYIFSQSSAQSLRDLEKVWIADVQASLKDALLILVGNKRDVDDEVRTRSQRQVT